MKSSVAPRVAVTNPVDPTLQASLHESPGGETDSTTPDAYAELEALRLPSNFGAAFGVKKILTRVPVGKPRNKFFRIRDGEDWTYRAFIYDDEGEIYLVAHEVFSSMDAGLFRAVQIHAGIDQNGQPFLLPVVLPDETGYRNSWHESLAHAVECAIERWIRIKANHSISGYDVVEAEGKIPDPKWTHHSMNELIDVAFRGRRILTLDHPVIRGLKGLA